MLERSPNGKCHSFAVWGMTYQIRGPGHFIEVALMFRVFGTISEHSRPPPVESSAPALAGVEGKCVRVSVASFSVPHMPVTCVSLA